MKSLARFWLSLFGIGFVPIAPGTAGSLLALPILFGFDLLFQKFSFPTQITFWIVLLLLVCWSGIAATKNFAPKKDPDSSWIVLDEFAGMLVACFPLFFFPKNWLLIGAAFLLFRLFDISKIWGIRKIDARKTPASVFWDDLVAGLYAALGVLVLIYFV
ncbi:MAG: phosphatidylglycerophosphatase A [Patescibacteria group bacterium]